MQMKPALLMSWIIYTVVSIYYVFTTKVEYKLWSISGYTFGISDLRSKIGLLVSFICLLLITKYSFDKMEKERKEFKA